jgi:hypothetical protein
MWLKGVEDEDPIPDSGKHSGVGYHITTPNPWDPGEGGGDQTEQKFGSKN